MKTLQHLLQWLFMRVEAVFNRAFGDKLNPLYHLGAISFFLFFVVAVSGLYLYAFFKTGVADAYGSVESLTSDQWYAGGIMRSVHRYASDGMVLAMAAHMLRHFAFGRFRGFRAFSWLTGIVLLWLVAVSGINGYMLPWDKLAQFVVVGAFEWLDWLPIFDGVLIRNFISQTSVNDRLFSLLAFIHLGAPLLVLLLMWVHVQRVPKAKTSPPREIAFCLLFTLLVLSLVKPAVSQGGAADFGVVPALLELDWFYLALFPLNYIWPLDRVWLLVIGATALLALFPWLPLKFRRGALQTMHITVHPDRKTLDARAGETILEAGLRQGLELPYECRNGGCGKCRCSILNGSIDPGAYQSSALSDADRASGGALMCCAIPRTDIEIEYTPQRKPVDVRTYSGRVEALERLSDDVMRVIVALPAGERIAFTAGQYINILLAGGERRAFSFANPPHENVNIELHVRLIPGGKFTSYVFTQMKLGDTLRFEGPLGEFMLQESARPILFVAGATGFAPIKSILEDAFRRGIRRPMVLYWGVKRRHDLYVLETVLRWQREHSNFTFVPVLSEPDTQDDWDGRRGLVHQAILADFPALAGYEVYVCGSVQMIETAFPAFLDHGMNEEFCFSDSFSTSMVKLGAKVSSAAA